MPCNNHTTNNPIKQTTKSNKKVQKIRQTKPQLKYQNNQPVTPLGIEPRSTD